MSIFTRSKYTAKGQAEEEKENPSEVSEATESIFNKDNYTPIEKETESIFNKDNYTPIEFDPEGEGYDYATARAAGGKPAENGHWSSLDPRTGQVLKGKKHETWDLMAQAEEELGNRVVKRDDGRYYSEPSQMIDELDKQAPRSYKDGTQKLTPENTDFGGKAERTLKEGKEDQDYGTLTSGYDSDYAVVRSIAGGLANITADISRIPAFVYDMYNLTGNAFAKVTGWEALKRESPDWMYDNKMTQWLEASAKSISYKKERYTDNGEDMWTLVNDGRFQEASDYFAHSILENAPTQVATVAAALSGFGLAGAIGLGVMSGAGKKAELEKEGIGEIRSTLAGIGNMTFEAGLELSPIGTVGGTGRLSKALIKSFGKAGTKELFKDAAKAIFGQMLGEGSEEFFTSIGQDLTDYVIAGKEDAMDGWLGRAVESYLIGMGSSATMTAPGAVGTAMRSAEAKVSRDKYWKDRTKGLTEEDRLMDTVFGTQATEYDKQKDQRAKYRKAQEDLFEEEPEIYKENVGTKPVDSLREEISKGMKSSGRVKNDDGTYTEGKNTWREGLKDGELLADGNVPLERKSLFGLDVGDKVTKIGIPAKNGKETSASRVTDFGGEAEYRGIYKDSVDGEPYMAFATKFKSGEEVLKMFKYDEENGELYLVNEDTKSILIHKAKFEKVEGLTSKKSPWEMTQEQYYQYLTDRQNKGLRVDSRFVKNDGKNDIWIPYQDQMENAIERGEEIPKNVQEKYHKDWDIDLDKSGKMVVEAINKEDVPIETRLKVAKRIFETTFAPEASLSALENNAIKEQIKKGEITEDEVKADPPVRVEYDNVVIFGTLRGALSMAKKKKGWGKLKQIAPLEVDDPIMKYNIGYAHKGTSPYRIRYEGRKYLKERLNKIGKGYGKYVKDATGSTLSAFMGKGLVKEGSVKEQEKFAAIERLGLTPEEFWRLAKNPHKHQTLLEKVKKGEAKQLEMFAEPSEKEIKFAPTEEGLASEAAERKANQPVRKKRTLEEMDEIYKPFKKRLEEITTLAEFKKIILPILEKELNAVGISSYEEHDKMARKKLEELLPQNPEFAKRFKEQQAKMDKEHQELYHQKQGEFKFRIAGRFSISQNNAVNRFLEQFDSDGRIAGNLQKYKNTPYYDAVVRSILVRQAIEDTVNKKPVRYENFLYAPSSANALSYIKKYGRDGVLKYIQDSSDGFIGHPEKPGNAINASFINCDPSALCAKWCYTAKGRNFPVNVVKQEFVSYAIETNPKRSAELASRQYKATMEFDANRALRLYDKGDGNMQWIPFIKEMNKQGVRLQIFSKKLDFLRATPDMNIKLLSIDSSNIKMADSNKDLAIAFVYSGERDLDFLNSQRKRFEERGGVVLAVVHGNKVLPESELMKIPTWATEYMCPVDSDFLFLKEIKGEDGWVCTRCDKNGGIGCFKGKVTSGLLQDLSKNLLELPGVPSILDNIKTLIRGSNEQVRSDVRKGLLDLVSEIEQEVESGIDPEEGRPTTEVPKRKTGKAKYRIDNEEAYYLKEERNKLKAELDKMQDTIHPYHPKVRDRVLRLVEIEDKLDQENIKYRQLGLEVDMADIYKEHRDFLVRWIRQHSPKVEAEDIAQEVFLDLSRKKNPKEFSRTWMISVARNKVAQQIRKDNANKRGGDYTKISLQAPIGNTGASVESIVKSTVAGETTMSAESKDMIEYVYDRMAKLPEGQARVMMLLAEGLTQKEISERLGIPLGTVAVNVKRGKAMMADLLKEAKYSRANEWYLKIVKEAEKLQTNKQGMIDVKSAYQKLMNSVSADELASVNLEIFLEDKTKVNKDELIQYLKDNQVEVGEVWFEGENFDGRPDEADMVNTYRDDLENMSDEELAELAYDQLGIELDDVQEAREDWLIDDLVEEYEMDIRERTTDEDKNRTRYADEEHNLPGGENYRELILTMPVKQKEFELDLDAYEEELKQGGSYLYKQPETGTYMFTNKEGIPFPGLYRTREQALKRAHQQAYPGYYEKAKDYESGHFPGVPGYILHIRMDDRMVGGKKYLFIQEIQSDREAQGDKRGYSTPETRKSIKRAREINAKMDEFVEETLAKGLTGEIDGLTDTYSAVMYLRENNAEYNALRNEFDTLPNTNVNDVGIPYAPGLKKWRMLAVKKVLRIAAEEGYDGVSWINGDQSVKRNNVETQLDNITYKANEDGAYRVTAKAIKDKRTVIDNARMTKEELLATFNNEIANKIIQNEGGDRLDALSKRLRDRGYPVKTFQKKHSAESTYNRVTGETRFLVVEEGADISKYPRTYTTMGEAQAVANRLSNDWHIKYEDGQTMGVWNSKADADKQMQREIADFNDPAKELRGKDLVIGGKFHRKIYDRDMPRWMSKFSGQKVDEIKIKTDNAPQSVIDQYADQPDHPFTKKQYSTQQMIPMTDELRSKIISEGQPLFRRPTWDESKVEQAAKDAQDEFGLAHVEKYMPELAKDLKRVHIIYTPEGIDAVGMYIRGRIIIKHGEGIDTYSHEIAHAFFDMFTSAAEKRAILDDVIERFDVKPTKKMTVDEVAEEILAEAFEDYRINKAKGIELASYKGTKLSKMLIEFFRKMVRLINKHFGMANTKTMEDFYDAILSNRRTVDNRLSDKAKYRKKANSNRTITGLIVEMGGIDPGKAEAAGYPRSSFKGAKIAHVLKKGGQGLDDLAGQLISEGTLQDDPNSNPSDILFQAMSNKMNLKETSESQYLKGMKEYLKEQEAEDEDLSFDTEEFDKEAEKELIKRINVVMKATGKPSVLNMSDVKRVIREETGQKKVGNIISKTEDQLLADKLKAESRGARIGYREGRAITAEEYKERIAALRKKFDESKNKEEKKNLLIKLRAEVKASKEGYREGKATEKARFAEMVLRQKLRKSEQKRLREMIQTLKDVKTGEMRPEFADPINELLASMDLSKPTHKTMAGINSLSAYLFNNPEADLPADVMEKLARMDKKSVTDLTMDEFQGLHDAILHYVHLNKLKNKIISKRKTQAKDEVVKGSVENMKDRPDKPTDLSKGTSNLTIIGGKLVETFGVRHEHPDLILETIGGRDSDLYKIMFDDINEGYKRGLEYQHEAEDAYANGLESMGFPEKYDIKDVDKWLGDKVKVMMEGKEHTLNRRDKITIARHMQTPENAKAILENGIVLKRNPVDVYRITPAEANAILNSLTEAEKAFLHPSYQLFENQYEQLNAVHVRTKGYRLRKVGLYFPLKRSFKGTIDETKSFSEQFKDKFVRIGLWKGMLKERTGGKHPVVIDGIDMVVADSVYNSAAYIGLEEALTNASKILFDPVFRNEIEARYGAPTWNVLNKYLKDMSNEYATYTSIETLLVKAKNPITAAILGLNPFVMAKQLASLSLYNMHIPMGDMLEGLIAFETNRQEILDRHMKYSTLFRERMESGYARDVSDIMKRGAERRFTGGKHTMQQKMMFGIKMFDREAVAIGMQAAVIQKLKELEKSDMTPEEKLKEAYKWADEVTSKTQPMFNPQFRSDISRGTVTEKMLTWFSSQVNQNLNILRRATRESIRTGNYTLLAKAITYVVFVNGTMMYGIDSLRNLIFNPDDDRESYWISLLKNTAGMFYLLRDVASSAANKLERGTFLGRGISNPLASAVDIAVNSMVDLTQALDPNRTAKQRRKSTEKAIDGMLSTLLTTQGLPYYTPKKIIQRTFLQEQKSNSSTKGGIFSGGGSNSGSGKSSTRGGIFS